MHADMYAGAIGLFKLPFMRKVAYDIADLSATIEHLLSGILMTQPLRLRLFISYAHEDNPFRQRLEKHLSPLKGQSLIEIWSDRAIEAGQEWEQSISRQIEIADIILLLISPDFLASKYIYENELVRAMERHEAGEARVIPIFLRPCYWEDEVFGKLQSVPNDAKPIAEYHNRDRAFTTVTKHIREAVNTLVRKAKVEYEKKDRTQKRGKIRKIERKQTEMGIARQLPGRSAQAESEGVVNYPVVSKSLDLCYVYSHEDEKLRDELAAYLRPFEQTGFISKWYDRKIGPENRWRQQIDQSLLSADIILILMSAAFAQTEYVFQVELKKALERHEEGKASVIPIILGPCRWEDAPFAGLQVFPKDGKPITEWSSKDKVLRDITNEIGRYIIQYPDILQAKLASSSNKISVSPFILNKNMNISLPELSSILHSTREVNSRSKSICPLLVIFGSGRFKGKVVQSSSGRSALVTDALFLPETIISISETLKLGHTQTQIQVKSALDIDFLNPYGNCDKQILGSSNILLSGTGEINCITGAVFEIYQELGLPIRPGCCEPYSTNIVGLPEGLIERRYSESPGLGLLVACANPWNRKYVCIITGGLHSAGTMGAIYLLYKYLNQEGRILGNNTRNEGIPGRVFEAALRKYQCMDFLLYPDNLTPPEDVRNIVLDVNKWRFLE